MAAHRTYTESIVRVGMKFTIGIVIHNSGFFDSKVQLLACCNGLANFPRWGDSGVTACARSGPCSRGKRGTLHTPTSGFDGKLDRSSMGKCGSEMKGGFY